MDYDEFWTLIEEENKIKSDINKELIKLNSFIFDKNKLKINSLSFKRNRSI
jgi:hypothetical protein